jgi:hypothetical protein
MASVNAFKALTAVDLGERFHAWGEIGALRLAMYSQIKPKIIVMRITQ